MSKTNPIIVQGIQIPSDATLKKYGLGTLAYSQLIARQNGLCPICGKKPTTGKMVVDHYHVKGYKKLPPEEKRKYIRGLTCWFCNHSYLGRGITIGKAKNVVKYLEEFELRLKPSDSLDSNKMVVDSNKDSAKSRKKKSD